MSRSFFPVLLVSCLLICAGCWDHTPVEETAFVVMLGVDSDPEDPKRTILTQMIVLPQAQPQGSSGAQGGAVPYYLVSQSGLTLSEAQMLALRHVPRYIELAHAQSLVFGEEFAREGIEEAVDWLIRQPQVRFGISIMVSRGTAQELMQAEPKLEALPPIALEGIMREPDPVAFTFNISFHEFAKKIFSEREDAAILVIERVDPMMAKARSGATAQAEHVGNELHAVGLAVFSGTRMVGILEGAAARGAVWVQGSTLNSINVPHPTEEDRYIAISFVKPRSNIDVSMEGDQLIIQVRVSAVGNLFEAVSAEALPIGPLIDEVEKSIEYFIKEEIEAAFDQILHLGADIFGIGERLYRRSPNDWRRVAPHWHEVYRQAHVDIQVDVTVTRTGLAR